MTDTDLIRDSARTLASRRTDLKQLRARRETLPGYEPALLTEMAESGWFGALLPEQYGGLGLGFADFATIAEELGAGLLGEPLVATAVLAPRALLHGDNEALKARLLPGVASGERLLALAWQEGARTWDPALVETVATAAGGGFTLSGRKRFVAGAAAAAGFLVSARGPDGVGLYWVEKDAPGLTLTTEWRADGTPAGVLELDRVSVGADAVAAKNAAAGLAAAIDEAATMAAAELVGVMTRALDTTLDYLRTREQFGRPIGSFQALQHKAVDLYLQCEVSRTALGEALAALDGGAAPDVRAMAVSRAKARCSDAGLRIGRDCVQLHGAMGFTDDCDIGLYLKRALVLAAWLGSTAAHHRRFAALRRPEPPPPPRNPQPPSAEEAAVMAKPVEDRGWDAMPEETFRGIARALFDRILSEDLRFISRRLGWKDIEPWYMALSQHGWLAPGWPVRYGGMGLGIAKQIIYFEEWGRIGAPRLLDHGLNNLGSILLARGSEEQRRRFLPKVLSGEHIWCQGYSEPNSGSDLASLRTEAVLDGDDFVINGRKIWSTTAHEANHMYVLVRTDKTVKKQAGISFLLVDLRQPGVTVRPIRNIAGHAEFCEVFFDDVRTPKENLVGALNDGWAVSRAVLGFERLRVGAPQFPLLALQRLERVAAAEGLAQDPATADRIAAVTCDLLDSAAMYARYAAAMRDGKNIDNESSLLKIWSTETMQRINETLVEVLGDAGAIAGMQRFGTLEADAVTPFLDTRAATIYGGTSQINRNILAKRVLGLP